MSGNSPIPRFPGAARSSGRAVFRLVPVLAFLLVPLFSWAGPPGAGWALYWSDEFSGSSLDTSKWTISTGSRRDATNTANAISVSGGALTVKTYTEGGNHYTGWVGTGGKFEHAFGYWEARIRFSSSAGMWSAFWIQPYGINNVGDAAGNGTEIDVAEHRRQDTSGNDLRNTYNINVHWDGYASSHKSVGTSVSNPGANSANFNGNYHLYGVEWTPWAYYFYVDGELVWQTSAAVSQVRQWIYLSSEVDNSAWAGNIPSGGYGTRSTSTTGFDVDYVRCYQRAEQTVNGGFGSRMGPWRQSGQTSWSSTGGNDGGAGAHLNPSTTSGSNIEHTVVGLLPNTPYVVRGWGDVGSRSWPDLRIGVKNFGGSQVYKSIWSNGFTVAEQPFTTGSSNSSAVVFAWVPTQYGDCYADDIEIKRAGRLTNAGFELGDTKHWSFYGDAFAHNWTTYLRSGSMAMRLNGNSASRGAEQAVYALKPATTYTFSGWVRAGGQPVRFGVKNHGGDEAFTTVTGTGFNWTKGAHTFTTGAASSSATVFVYAPAGSNVGAVDLDDFLLAEALPAPWTNQNIGSGGRNGEAAASDGHLVVRGGGSDIWGTADNFHFVSQPMTGPGKISARLASFEGTNDLSKAGVMLRGSADVGSAHALLDWLPQGRVEFIWRSTDGGTSSSDWSVDTVSWPPRLRLVRSGSLVTASYSTDGSTWVQVGSPQTINLPETCLAGLAVNAHDSATTSEAVFSSVSFSGDGDNDGLPDEDETNTGVYVSATNTGTDPDNPDTDGDGLLDGEEVLNGTNPLVPNNEFTWQPGATPGGSGTWDAATSSWRHGANQVPWESGRTALFGSTAGTVTVSSGVSGVAGLLFNTAGYTLSGSGPLALADPAVLQSPVGAVTINTPLAGVGSLTVNGGQQVNLQGDNRGYAGSVIVDGNTQLRCYNTGTSAATGNELGGSSTTIDLRSGSQIRWYNVAGTTTYAANFRLNGAGVGALGGNPGVLNLDGGTGTTRTVTLNGAIGLDSDATIATQNNAQFVCNGPLSGNGNTLTWSQHLLTSTFNAPVQLGGLVKTGTGTLAFGAAATPDIGTLTYSAGTLTFASNTTAGIQTIVLTANWALAPGSGATFLIPSAVLGTPVITKTGAGTLVLSGPNGFGPVGGTYAFGSGTTDNFGVLRLAHGQALGNHSKISMPGNNSAVSVVELSGGKTFPLSIETAGRNANPVSLRSVDGLNTWQGSVTITATGGAYAIESLAGSTLVISGNLTSTLNAASARDLRVRGDGDIILLGALSDSATATPTRLNVTKEGTGTFRLTGTCTHANATTVNAGTLRVDGTFTASAVNVAASGTLAGTGAIPSASVTGKIACTIGEDPLDVSGALTLTNATLALSGTASAPVHVLVNRGSMTGSFASITGVPVGYTLNTAYNGTSIALVRNAAADYEIWAAAHALTPSGTASAALDPDHDGLPNMIEFVLNLDPGSGWRNAPNLPAAQRSGSTFVVSFTRLKSAAANGFSSTLEWTQDPGAGPWTAATAGQTSVVDHGDTETVTATIPVPAGAEALFARLRVTGP